MSEQKNIFQRINEVKKKIGYVKKDKVVSGQGYKAVTHDVVTAMTRNHLIDHGIVVVSTLDASNTTDIGQTKNGAPIIRYTASYMVDFVNADDPGDLIRIKVESHANDSGDKAPGKAMSYAVKYAMLKMFSIETGEDEESRFEAYPQPLPEYTEEQYGENEANWIAAIDDKKVTAKEIVTRIKSKYTLPKEIEASILELGAAEHTEDIPEKQDD